MILNGLKFDLVSAEHINIQGEKGDYVLDLLCRALGIPMLRTIKRMTSSVVERIQCAELRCYMMQGGCDQHSFWKLCSAMTAEKRFLLSSRCKVWVSRIASLSIPQACLAYGRYASQVGSCSPSSEFFVLGFPYYFKSVDLGQLATEDRKYPKQ